MNRMTLIVAIVAVAVIGIMALSWSQMKAPQPTAVPVPVAQVAEVPVQQVAPSAGEVTPPASAPATPAPVTPAASAPVVATQVAQKAAPIAPPASIEQAASVPNAAPAIPPGLRETLETNFKNQLSFDIDEAKMLSFTRAALRIEKINERWDVQIAGAETDAMAIEYNNFAVEESAATLASMKDLTAAQYNELTSFTAKNPEFNRIYLAYKQLVEEGAFGPDPSPPASAKKAPPQAQPSGSPAAAPTDKPVAPSAVAPVLPLGGATPSATPAGSGTAPASQGSPVLPYSPPQGR